MTLRQERIEGRLADLFGYAEAVLFGRARSGVVALLNLLGMGEGSSFVMPSNLCPSLYAAVQGTGVDVRLATVGADNGLARDEAMADAIVSAGTARRGIVMPAHLYGLVQDYPRTLAAARACGWFVLENDTIATRARIGASGGVPFGDALLVSFGHAKGIEVGAGGALMTNYTALAAALRACSRNYPDLDDLAVASEYAFDALGRRLRNSSREECAPDAGERERMLLAQTPPCRFRFPAALCDALDDALDAFPAVVDARLRRKELWERALARCGDGAVAARAACLVPWRLTVRVPEGRNRVVDALRAARFDAGTNYPPLWDSFPVLLAGQRTAEAERWADEVLNLWLTDDYDAARIDIGADIVANSLAKEGAA